MWRFSVLANAPPNGTAICNWSFLLENNWMETAGKSFLLETLKENWGKKCSTVKTQVKLQERVFYWKNSRKTEGNSFRLQKLKSFLLEKLWKNSRKTARFFFLLENSRKTAGKSFQPEKLKENCRKEFSMGKTQHCQRWRKYSACVKWHVASEMCCSNVSAMSAAPSDRSAYINVCEKYFQTTSKTYQTKLSSFGWWRKSCTTSYMSYTRLVAVSSMNPLISRLA